MMPDPAMTAGLVLGVIAAFFVALTVVGVVMLARRARRAAGTIPPGRTAAGVALVRADDAVRTGADDLAYATAQFGEERTRDFAAALDRARADLATAFALQQKLDDAAPEGEQRRRDWTKRIRALADRARESLAAEAAAFEQLRRAEADAPATLQRIRESIRALTDRRSASTRTLDDLAARYVPDAFSSVADSLAGTDAALATAGVRADAAEAALTASRVTAVSGALRDAESAIGTASALLDALDRRRDELAAAEAEIADLVRAERAALAVAAELRDSPPDPDSADALNASIAALEARLAATGRKGRRDPVSELDQLVDAADALEIAVAAARNQQRRLDGARAALAGALVSAHAQLSAASDYIGAHGGGAGARTRLAEGERELLIARNESDPVAALDAARRAQTHARDADALARYSGR